MKKLLVVFLAMAFMLVSASVASATLYYAQTWEDDTVNYISVDAGVPVTFVYQSYDTIRDNTIQTDINLLFRGEADFPAQDLIDDTSVGGTSGTYEIDTTDLTQGHYIIQGTAINVNNNADNWTELLEFFVYNDNNVDTDNNPPHFLPIKHFVYDLATTTQDNVLAVADYARDEDGDALTYAIDTSAMNDSIMNCNLYEDVQGTLACEFYDIGQTSITLFANDGEFPASHEVFFTIIDSSLGANSRPYFENLNALYRYDISEGAVTVVDLANFAEDADNDSLTFTIDTTATNTAVVDCNLAGAVLSCNLVGVGNTRLDVIVSDGQLEAKATLYLTVVSEQGINHAPIFQGLPESIAEPFDYQETFVAIADVGMYGYDEDNDPLTYALDTSNTDADVVTCKLTIANALVCDMFSAGTTSVVLSVFDGKATTSATITIQIVDNASGPTAIIYGPNVAVVDEVLEFDGSASTAAPGKTIVNYQWEITDDNGSTVKLLYGKSISASLAQPGSYIVNLLVVDEDGRSDVASAGLIVTGYASEEVQSTTNRNLQVNSIQIIGTGYETALPGDDLRVYVTVTNDVGYDLEDVKATFSVPDFGVRFKSKAMSIDDGEKVTLTIFGYVPDYVEPDVYYPEISVSADGFHRAKISYLEVEY
ncbi:PKD domain-containing protein [Candidatus Woesearchaeota archaeon]|nr:PKD domain-containing protein [Candidatus Woesearchaeota archaeon]